MDDARAGRTELLRNLLLLLLLTRLLVSAAYDGAVRPGPEKTGADFQVYYRAADRLNHGQPLYILHPGELPYAYAPPLALLLRPLALLPYPAALTAWFFLGVCCLLLGIGLYATAAGITSRDATALALILIVSFRFWPTTMNFGLGQTNLILLLAVCGMIRANARGKLAAAAILIALAALIKAWMLGLAIYLLFRRAWSAAALSVVTYAVLLAGSFTIVGWREWPAFLRVSSAAGRIIVERLPTQSIFGFARLHFRANGIVQPLIDNPFLEITFVVAGLVVVALGLAYVMLRPTRSAYETRLRFGFVILSILLVLPTTEAEYLVLCLPLFWTLLAPSRRDAKPLPSRMILAAILAYLMLTRGWLTLPVTPARYHGARSLLASVEFFAASLLWLITLAAIRAMGRASGPAPAPEPENTGSP